MPGISEARTEVWAVMGWEEIRVGVMGFVWNWLRHWTRVRGWVGCGLPLVLPHLACTLPNLRICPNPQVNPTFPITSFIARSLGEFKDTCIK